PDGEFVHLIVGAVIGGFMNLMMNAHNVDNFWQGLGYFGIGAAAGALGAGVGAGISSAMAGGTFGAGFVGSSAAMSASSSFITGAAIGGGAGFASGFTTGLGNGLMGGQNFGQALGSGLKGGAIGGLSGAAIGGIVGGIQNQRQLIAFRKGNQSLGINGSDPVPATDEFLSKAQKAWYKNAPMDKVRTFTVENVPASIQNTLDANNAPALTRALSTGGKLIGFSNVYFNNNLAFLSAKDLFYSMGHEFVHVSQFAALAGQSASLLRQPGFMDMLEFHAYSYQNTLGGTQFSSFTRAEIINWQNTYPQLFNSMGWMSFPWTSAHSFSYPF
ncbi:MAG: RHS repeat-associated core domain-containing protein, partial [Tannerella sp.]|nr:RHS repeat-associated core domain-containing protein [Tannerella sp.]